MTPAEFLKSKGWKVGDILLGHATEYEKARVIRITAIGEERVLARTLTTRMSVSESLYTFDLREWELAYSDRELKS